MMKIKWDFVGSIILASMITLSLAFLFLNGLRVERKSYADKQRVCWTELEATHWTNLSSQKVARVVLGLRADGVVVWKEDVMFGHNTSCVVFDDAGNRIGEWK